MITAVSVEKRKTFRHGDLRNALIAAGLAMARLGGPSAVILREATRQAGVSPNAAYRHFASQADLLDAVRLTCLTRVEAAIEEESAKIQQRRYSRTIARNNLYAVGIAYLRFALDEPGIFRTAFSSPPPFGARKSLHVASEGQQPCHLLSLALDRMTESGLLSKRDRHETEYLAWSTVHGLALLALDGPLQTMPQETVLALGKRLVTMVERGLC